MPDNQKNQNFPNFGKNVHQYRKLRGYTTETLAELANLSRTYLCDLESGKKMASLQAAYRLSVALVVPLDTLLFGDAADLASQAKRQVLKDTIDLLTDAEAECVFRMVNDILPLTRIWWPA